MDKIGALIMILCVVGPALTWLFMVTRKPKDDDTDDRP